MPEGDTLHRLARKLGPALTGKALTRLDLPRTTLDTRELRGRRVEKVEAIGKHLLVHVEGDLVLLTHLKMNGAWHLYRPGDAWRKPRGLAVAVVEVEGAQAVCFHAPVVRLLHARDLKRDPGLRWLGPDILGETFDVDRAIGLLRALDEAAIAVAITDQRAVAGIGNVWKSELLYREGFDPFANVARFTDAELEALLLRGRRSMQAAVEGRVPAGAPGRSSLEEGDVGWLPLAVYERAGEACERCGTTIRAARQALRWTWWCPRCQVRRA